MNEKCNKLVTYGFILRYTLTVLSLLYLYTFSNKFIKKYIFLILPFLIEFLDNIDIFPAKIYSELQKYGYVKNMDHTKDSAECIYHFYYQSMDKICDSISYILAFLFLSIYFKVDVILLFFIMYRIIGVVLFYITKDSSWLILFFDFIKEYILYLFIFNKNYVYIPIFIFLKISFEIYWHKFKNNKDYKLDK